MFPALGLYLFYKKRSNTYKHKDEGLGMDVPPNTMESDSAMTLVQDSNANLCRGWSLEDNPKAVQSTRLATCEC